MDSRINSTRPRSAGGPPASACRSRRPEILTSIFPTTILPQRRLEPAHEVSDKGPRRRPWPSVIPGDETAPEPAGEDADSQSDRSAACPHFRLARGIPKSQKPRQQGPLQSFVAYATKDCKGGCRAFPRCFCPNTLLARTRSEPANAPSSCRVLWPHAARLRRSGSPHVVASAGLRRRPCPAGFRAARRRRNSQARTPALRVFSGRSRPLLSPFLHLRSVKQKTPGPLSRCLAWCCFGVLEKLSGSRTQGLFVRTYSIAAATNSVGSFAKFPLSVSIAITPFQLAFFSSARRSL